MASILLFLGQISLALYTSLIISLVLIYLVKNFSYNEEIQPKPKSELFEKHLAIVYYDFASEKEIFDRIKELQNQNYYNYTAYFFTKTPIIEVNNLNNVKIIRPLHTRLNGLNFLEIVKQFIDKTPDAVIAISRESSLNSSFLNCMNLNLLQGKKAVQSQVIINGNNESLGIYQKVAREVLNLIDREAPNAFGISAAIWEQGFMLDYQIFRDINFHFIANNDKLLQAELICRSIKIDYDAKAIILGKTLKNEDFKVKKNSHLKMYYHNFELGFKLLYEGLRHPNIDKIIFGFNYLRPPIYLALASSFLLLFSNIKQDQNNSLFETIAVIGIVGCVLVLLKGHNFIRFLNQLQTRSKNFGSNYQKHDHSSSYINYNKKVKNININI
jgi:hypothetical protein